MSEVLTSSTSIFICCSRTSSCERGFTAVSSSWLVLLGAMVCEKSAYNVIKVGWIQPQDSPK